MFGSSDLLHGNTFLGKVVLAGKFSETDPNLKIVIIKIIYINNKVIISRMQKFALLFRCGRKYILCVCALIFFL